MYASISNPLDMLTTNPPMTPVGLLRRDLRAKTHKQQCKTVTTRKAI